MKKRLLLFGFEKFDKLKSNPTIKIVQSLEQRMKDIFDVHTTILPVKWGSKNVIQEITAFKPHYIVGFGVSGHPRIALERIALNYFDAARPDNAGKIVRHRPIIPKAPLALETNFPIEKMNAFLQAQEIPSTISYHAHTYLCNYAYYLILHQLHEKKTNAKIIFIHVPFSPAEVNELEMNAPSFPVENTAEVVAKFLLKMRK